MKVKQVRLLPIVVFAGSALLGLKLVGLVSGTGYTLTGIGTVAAQTVYPTDLAAAEADESAADAAAALLFGGQGDAPVPIPAVASPTEAVLMDRLGERRTALDALEAELTERLMIVEAAERRLDERMAELLALEARVSQLVAAQGEAHGEHFAAVVAMYAAMRARDAAAIFNDLDMEVLVAVGRAMDPRTLGPIVAAMETSRAQALTVRLAAPQPPEFALPASVATGPNDLPQIVGQ